MVKRTSNKPVEPATPDMFGQNAQQQLLSVVERLERLDEELDGTKEDIKEVFAEAKGNGFDVPILRKVMRVRKMDQAKRSEMDAIFDLYETAILNAEKNKNPANRAATEETD